MDHAAEEAVRVMAQNSIMLQNAINEYAVYAKKSLSLLEGEQYREARLERIEQNLVRVGGEIKSAQMLVRANISAVKSLTSEIRKLTRRKIIHKIVRRKKK